MLISDLSISAINPDGLLGSSSPLQWLRDHSTSKFNKSMIIRTSECSSSSPPFLKTTDGIKVPSVIKKSFRREYLSDYRKFRWDTALLTIVARSALVSALPIQLQFMNFQIEQDRKRMKRSIDRKSNDDNSNSDSDDDDGEDVEEFDWDSKVPGALRAASYSFLKLFGTELVILKVYQRILIRRLGSNTRLADKMLKAVNDSLIRKVSKFPLATACYRGIFTYIRGTALLNLSLLTFDVLEKLSLTLYEYWNERYHDSQSQKVAKKGYIVEVLNGSVWLFKRTGYHGLTLVVRSIGLSLGTFLSFGNVTYGGSLIGLLLADLSTDAILKNLSSLLDFK